MMKTPELYDIFRLSSGISTDSRNVGEGNIFFALKGESFDGNAYADDALGQGAAWAVVDDPGVVKNDRYILVEDPIKTLQDLANFHRHKFHIPFIAITGTNGKTTTKELVRDVLSAKYRVTATTGNLNNHIGVPLTILGMDDNAEIAVVEMGANHVGEIKRLCQVTEPTHGLITNIGIAHIEGFGSPEGVIKAKSELYDYIRESDGLLFVNESQEILNDLSKGMKKITYGPVRDANFNGEVISSEPFVSMRIRNHEGVFELSTMLFGSYNQHNILAAWAVGEYFGVSPEMIVQQIESYRPSNMRSQVVETERNMVILDAYNANPTSVQYALDDFLKAEGTKKMVILGDMLELGEISHEEHRKILELVRNMNFHEAIFVGPVFQDIAADSDHSFSDQEEAARWLKDRDYSGYKVLVKGSRKIGLESLLTYL